MRLLLTDSVTIQRAMRRTIAEERHRDNTIPTEVWRGIWRRCIKPPPDSPERARRQHLAELQFEARKRGWN